ncbi:MAG: hypothetical protein ACXW30_00635 [Micavibrio sp.]
MSQKLKFVILLLVLSFGLCFTQAYADSLDPFFGGIENISIIPMINTDVDDPEIGSKAIQERHPELTRGGLLVATQKILYEHLSEEGKKKIKFFPSKENSEGPPIDSSGYVISVTLNVRFLEVDGNKHKIGAITVKTYRVNPEWNKFSPKYSGWAFYMPHTVYGGPAEIFLITEDRKSTEKNFKKALEKILFSYAVIKGN